MPFFRFAACFLLALTAFGSQAQDDLAARKAAADRYLELVPIAPLVEDTIAKMALQLPAASRRDFVATMQLIVDRKSISASVRQALVETFTLEELLALNAFYQSRVGGSIAQKMPAYGAAMTPALLEELRRGASRYEETRRFRR